MSERKYSVAEIDALREVVRHKYISGNYPYRPDQQAIDEAQDMQDSVTDYSWSGASASVGRSSNEEKMDRFVEERVRTHMLAGHIADDFLVDPPPRQFQFWQEGEPKSPIYPTWREAAIHGRDLGLVSWVAERGLGAVVSNGCEIVDLTKVKR